MTGTTFRPDRAAYLRAHAWMAAVGMAGAMAVLWFIGSPYAWTGAVGALAAVAIRGWYLASEELDVTWTMTDTRLTGPGWRDMALADITAVRSLGSAVQVITANGDKHLLKFLADPADAKARIEAASLQARAATG